MWHLATCTTAAASCKAAAVDCYKESATWACNTSSRQRYPSLLRAGTCACAALQVQENVSHIVLSIFNAGTMRTGSSYVHLEYILCHLMSPKTSYHPLKSNSLLLLSRWWLYVRKAWPYNTFSAVQCAYISSVMISTGSAQSHIPIDHGLTMCFLPVLP